MHLAAQNYFGWCKHWKTFRSHALHPSPFYVIIQVPWVFQKILSCTPRPSTYPLSTIFYKKKCLNKRLNWSMFPPKNRLLIYSLNDSQRNIWISQTKARSSCCIIMLLNPVFRGRLLYVGFMKYNRVYTRVSMFERSYMFFWQKSSGLDFDMGALSDIDDYSLTICFVRWLLSD